MRPLEWVLLLGGVGLVAAWMARRTVPRWLPLGLIAVLIAHVVLEGQRATMWPLYAVIGLSLLPRRPALAPAAWWRRAGRVVVGGLVLTLGVLLPWWLPVMTLPAPSGPFAVGTSWLVITDSSRLERFAAGRVPREFPVRAWFPAAPGAAGQRAPYAKPAEMSFGMIPAFFFDQLRLVKTHSLANAVIAPGTDRFPVVVFSHGYGGAIAQNTPQMEELASHGYVVLSIGHTGEAGTTVFPDGRTVPLDAGARAAVLSQGSAEALAKAQAAMKALEAATTREERDRAFRVVLQGMPEPIRTESVREWSADTKALVDRLALLDSSGTGAPFAGRLDLARLGIMGMSYGGATAGEFCRLDSRCKAGFNLDGGQFGGLVDDSLSVPFFIMASEQAYSMHVPVLDLTRGPAYLVRVPQTTHLGLTDLSLVAPALFRWSGLGGRLDPARRQAIMSRYTLAFFDTYLKGQHSPLLDGPPATDPDISFVRSNP